MKYIVELKPEYEDSFKGLMILGAKDSNLFVDALAVEDIEELNSDYINEHYGELQNEAYQKGYEACMSENDFDSPCTSCEAYQRGLYDAWEAVRKIADMWETMDNDDLLETFGITARIGESTIGCLLKKQNAKEAMLKLKAYEEQKADDEIKVGDEVISLRKNGEVIEDMPPWIVTYETKYSYQGLDACGMLHNNPKDRARKTGRHFSIDKILEEMRHD